MDNKNNFVDNFFNKHKRDKQKLLSDFKLLLKNWYTIYYTFAGFKNMGYLDEFQDIDIDDDVDFDVYILDEHVIGLSTHID